MPGTPADRVDEFRTSAGTATPIVSARAISHGPARRALGELDDALDRDLAFEGAAEGRRDGDVGATPAAAGAAASAATGVDGVGGHALVAQAEGVAGDDHQVDLVEPAAAARSKPRPFSTRPM